MNSLVDTSSLCLNDRRSQSRFPTAAPLAIVAGRTRAGEIEVTRIDGQVVNVSASAVLIAIDQAIEYDRVWIRIFNSGQALSECVVVRQDAGDENIYHYAVKFTCDWSAAVISKLLASLK